MPDVSIVMPSFNQDRFLRQAIDSVLNQQGGFEVELIVIDGGSTDLSVAILESFGDQIRWGSEPDDGQTDALNKGIAMATGAIIGWLNSDDLYEPTCLSHVLPVFENEPETQWVYGKVRIVDESNNEIRQWITRYKNRRMRRFSRASLMTENWISQMGVFWRRSIGETVGSFRTELKYTMDYDYWLRLSKIAPGRFIDEDLASFRWYTSSKSGDNFSAQMKEDLETAIRNANGEFPLSILMHRFNRWKIVTAYSMMRLFQQETSAT